MRRMYTALLVLPVFFFISPYLAGPFDLNLEKDLQKNLEKSRMIIGRAEENLRAGFLFIIVVLTIFMWTLQEHLQ